MTRNYRLHKCLQFGLVGFVGWLSISLLTAKTQAQQSNIVPDNTLGAEASQVITNFEGETKEVITGGAIRQINLFHSFGEFNISAGREAYFFSPNADIQNIFARVTGNNPSEILGRLGTFGNSQPNLYLINPNGIVFGENASLDVQGSFVGTTANGIQFANQGNFSATNPEAVPLLTVNPSALLFNQIHQGEIINRSRQIFTPGSFYLVGGNITFDGGIAGSLGNRLELGAVAGTGNVELTGSGNQMQLAFPESLSKADIFLQNNAFALTTGGGAITINARNISLFGNSFISSLLQPGEGQSGVAAGDVVLNATGDITLDNVSSIASQGSENSLGDTGNIVINAQSIRLINQSIINSNGPRSRGNIVLNAKDYVSLDNSFITTSGIFNPIGKSGDITITTGNINLSNQSAINSGNIGQGQGGKITLKAQEAISLNSGSNISSASVASGFGQVNDLPSGDIEIKTRKLTLDGSNTLISSLNLDEGRGGNIQIFADDSILLNGLALILSSSTGQGDAGNIQLETRSLTLANGGNIGTQSSGLGNSGNLLVNASDSVTLSGIATFIAPQTGDRNIIGSILSTSAFGTGKSGELTINTQRLSISDGGDITTISRSGGGDLTINAKDSVEVVGNSLNKLSAISTNTLGSGDAGSLRINTGRLSIRDGGRVLASTFAKGNGGNLTVNADRSVEIIGSSADDRFFSALAAAAETGSTGNAGNLTITTPDLLVRDGAQVSTGTFGAGKGGNLFVNASNKVELIGISTNGQTISALAASVQQGATGDAGSLTINTQDLLVRDGAAVSTATFGAGKGGNLTVNASGSVEVIGASANGLFKSTLSTQGLTGNAGDLTINAQNLLVRDGGQVDAATFDRGKGGNLTVNATGKVELIGTSPDGSAPTVVSTSALAGSTGDAGDLTINVQDLFVQDGAQISASTSGRGKAGNLAVNASGKVELIGTSADGQIISGLAASVQQGATGDAGSLTIHTQDLLVRDGAAVSTATFGAGKGGNLTVNAANSVELTGTSIDGRFLSGLSASAYAGSTGDAGNLQVDTQDLLVRDGAQIFTGTFSTGKAGNLTVNASRQIELIGRSRDGIFPSGLLASAEPESTGNAGDMKINTPQLLVNNGAEVLVNARGTGNAGIMTINADTIRLNNQAALNANTRTPNKDPNKEQATINLNTQNLTLRQGSSITTNATGENVIGGNINIDTKFLVAVENSRISANSDNSRGGRVVVNAEGVFVGSQPSDTSQYITATSGVGLSGTVDVNSPDNSSIQNSLSELSPNLIDTNALIASSCIARGTQRQENSFIITGSGALRANRPGVLISNYATGEVRSINTTPRPWKKGDPIIEAQGFYRLNNGRLLLSRECS